MPADEPRRYLTGLDDGVAEDLLRLNRTGIEAIRSHLDTGAIAFLGAGVSSPLYPLWGGLIEELLDAVVDMMDPELLATCRAEALRNPESVAEMVAKQLRGSYRSTLRKVLHPRNDRVTGKSWTPAHEAIVRRPFQGIITTNFDSGISDARLDLRPGVANTGFATWTNDDTMDGWQTGDALSAHELPVLYAHGHHTEPKSIVLASSDYRRAYSGKLGRVLASLIDTRHLVWMGFSFSDRRITAVINAVQDGIGANFEFEREPRHVAVIGWDPTDTSVDGGPASPVFIRNHMASAHGCHTVLYPTPGGDHSALVTLLDELAPAVVTDSPGPARPITIAPAEEDERLAIKWVHGGETPAHFTGRSVELARLDRWAADPDVAVIGVTAWGGAGKTSLLTKWANDHAGGSNRAFAGGFAWSFYENASAEAWATELIAWAARTFDHRPPAGRGLDGQVLDVTRTLPLLLILDGLEVIQDGPAGSTFGRLLQGIVRDVLTGLCLGHGASLAALTSRFPFADLEGHDGTAARMLDVPPMIESDGADLLERSGAGWLDDDTRVDLVRRVDGHPLALTVLASALASRPPTHVIDALREDLADALRTDSRVARVLRFYSEGLSEADRMLVALVSMFQRPVSVDTIITLARGLGTASLTGLDARSVEAAARQRLHGVLTWHADGTLSAHPIVRDTFRPLVLSAENAVRASEIELADLPRGSVGDRDAALQVVEMIELLLEAGEMDGAEELWRGRADDGHMWQSLPAVRLGQRAAAAFVATPERRAELAASRHGFYINEIGLRAMQAGDVETALMSFEERLRSGDSMPTLRNVSSLHALMGDADAAIASAEKALERLGTRRRSRPPSPNETVFSLTCLARGLDLAGRTVEASARFEEADALHIDNDRDHLASKGAIDWADHLLRTGRAEAALELTEQNRDVSALSGWNQEIARCDRLLARLAIHAGEVGEAEPRLRRATATFRQGDMDAELCATLVDLAEQRRLAGDLDEAEQLASEAAYLAGPRTLRPTHGAALACRARVRIDQSVMTGDPVWLGAAFDDADHAYRLATRLARMPWVELVALEALDAIADARGEPRSPAAGDLRARLVPPGLPADPLALAMAAAWDLRKARLDTKAQPPS